MKVEEFVWMVKNSELQHSLLPEDCFINTFNLHHGFYINFQCAYMYLGVYFVSIFQLDLKN